MYLPILREAILNLILVTPDQLETIGPRELSERIVQGIAGPDTVDLFAVHVSSLVYYKIPYIYL